MKPPVIATFMTDGGKLECAAAKTRFKHAGAQDASWALLLAASVVCAVRVFEWCAVPWPRCGFRLVTGIPCPFCGTTRCLIAAAHLRLAEALFFNPLVTGVSLGFAAWALLRVARIEKTPSLGQISERLTQKPWSWVFVSALVLNWVYLVLFLP